MLSQKRWVPYLDVSGEGTEKVGALLVCEW